MLPLKSFTSRPSRYSAFSMLVGESGLDIRYEQAYGPHPRHRLDVYRSHTDNGAGAVALFLYGGSWRGGSRSCYGFVGAALAASGIPTAVADYRLFPEVRWPLFQEDAAAAFRWVAKELGEKGARPAVVVGHSAGAHMAALLALDRRWLGEARPAALVGLSGPYAFQPTTWPSTKEIFATARDADEPRPIAFAGADAPPVLLMHGAADDTVKPHNASDFADVLRAAGSEVELEMVAGADHKALVMGFAQPFRRRVPVHSRTVGFIRGLTAAGSALTPAGSGSTASRRAG